MHTRERFSVIRALPVAQTPRPGQTITLPKGLLITNEFYAVREVIAEPIEVRVTARDRDEFFWRNGERRSCYARFTIAR